MDTDRLNDMTKRYGEFCDKKFAAKILSVQPRTISLMIHEGRLRLVDGKVEVRSIAAYIESPYEVNFQATPECKPVETLQVSRNALLNVARRGHWNSKLTT